MHHVWFGCVCATTFKFTQVLCVRLGEHALGAGLHRRGAAHGLHQPLECRLACEREYSMCFKSTLCHYFRMHRSRAAHCPTRPVNAARNARKS